MEVETNMQQKNDAKNCNYTITKENKENTRSYNFTIILHENKVNTKENGDKKNNKNTFPKTNVRQLKLMLKEVITKWIKAHVLIMTDILRQNRMESKYKKLIRKIFKNKYLILNNILNIRFIIVIKINKWGKICNNIC